MLTAAGALPGSAQAPETVASGEACATDACHADYVGREHEHWDAEEFREECEDCHERDGDEHDFSTEAPPELCMTCHDPVAAEAVVHPPAEEDCLDCHDPHGSDTAAMLNEPPLTLCFDCHDEDLLEGRHQHDPAAEGDCMDCHRPHSSPNATLLVAAGNALCAECHDEPDDVADAESAHDPAEDDCTNCHNPHSGPYPYMLPAEKRHLCDECHDDVVLLAENASTDHEAVLTGEECLNCHSPHASDDEPLLVRPQPELCLECHDRRVDSDGVWLANIRLELKRSPRPHAPIEEDGCSRCHDPHGSERFRLLSGEFPRAFYQPFETGAYGLCFSCHEKTLATAAQSRSATGFRDGDRNLHFVHVNRKEKGRTCRACHAVHASPNPAQIAERVPFGAWRMPINYERTETGGSCAPGCHDKASYDRGAAARR